MSLVPMISPAGATATVRCECARCGSHVTVRRSWQLSGMCGNCRGYELRPLASVPESPAPGPAADAVRTPARLDPPRIPWPEARVA